MLGAVIYPDGVGRIAPIDRNRSRRYDERNPKLFFYIVVVIVSQRRGNRIFTGVYRGITFFVYAHTALGRPYNSILNRKNVAQRRRSGAYEYRVRRLVVNNVCSRHRNSRNSRFGYLKNRARTPSLVVRGGCHRCGDFIRAYVYSCVVSGNRPCGLHRTAFVYHVERYSVLRRRSIDRNPVHSLIVSKRCVAHGKVGNGCFRYAPTLFRYGGKFIIVLIFARKRIYCGNVIPYVRSVRSARDYIDFVSLQQAPDDGRDFTLYI